MKVGEKERQKHRNRIFTEKDKNFDFLTCIADLSSEKKALSQTKFSSLFPKTKAKIDQLDVWERLQWSVIITTKIKHTYNKLSQIKNTLSFQVNTSKSQQIASLSKIFRERLKMLITICQNFEIEYESSEIEEMLKDFYFWEYGQEALVYFCAVDFECSKYQKLPKRKIPPLLACCNQQQEKVDIIIDDN